MYQGGLRGFARIVDLLVVVTREMASWRKRARTRRRMLAGARAIADHEVVTLRGTVRVIGEPMLAPLSGTPCVAHVSSVRVLGGGELRPMLVGPMPVVARTARETRAAVSRAELVEFILETSEGEVRVSGDRAEVTARPTPVIPRDLDREAAFLAASDLAGVRSRDAVSEEVLVEPGAKIEVHGVARVEMASPNGQPVEQGYRDAPRTIRLVGDAAHPLTIHSR